MNCLWKVCFYLFPRKLLVLLKNVVFKIKLQVYRIEKSLFDQGTEFLHLAIFKFTKLYMLRNLTVKSNIRQRKGVLSSNVGLILSKAQVKQLIEYFPLSQYIYASHSA